MILLFAVILASGSGSRLKGIASGAPKHLLEVDPHNSVELKRTLVGRLVSQFSSFPEVKQIFVLASDVAAFKKYFASFPQLSGRLEVVKHEHAYDWRGTFRQLGSLIGRSPAVTVGGDFVLPNSLIRRAILRARKGRALTIFIGHNVPGGKMFPKPAAAIWSVSRGAPSWVLEYSPEGWKDFPRLLKQHYRDIGLRFAGRVLNVNTPADLEKSRRKIRSRRFSH